MTSDRKTTYIALLRGINVGGHKRILMADLRKLIETIGFLNVKTYIQTGNILFTAKEERNNISIANQIEKAIHDTYNFEVPVMVRTIDELDTIIKNNPYCNAKEDNIERLHLTLLNEMPSNKLVSALKTFDCLKYSPILRPFSKAFKTIYHLPFLPVELQRSREKGQMAA